MEHPLSELPLLLRDCRTWVAALDGPSDLVDPSWERMELRGGRPETIDRALDRGVPLLFVPPWRDPTPAVGGHSVRLQQRQLRVAEWVLAEVVRRPRRAMTYLLLPSEMLASEGETRVTECRQALWQSGSLKWAADFSAHVLGLGARLNPPAFTLVALAPLQGVGSPTILMNGSKILKITSMQTPEWSEPAKQAVVELLEGRQTHNRYGYHHRWKSAQQPLSFNRWEPDALELERTLGLDSPRCRLEEVLEGPCCRIPQMKLTGPTEVVRMLRSRDLPRLAELHRERLRATVTVSAAYTARLQANDVLVPMASPRPSEGVRAWAVPFHFEGTLPAPDVTVLRLKEPTKYNVAALMAFIGTDFVRSWLFGRALGGPDELSYEALKDLPIPSFTDPRMVAVISLAQAARRLEKLAQMYGKVAHEAYSISGRLEKAETFAAEARVVEHVLDSVDDMNLLGGRAERWE